MRVLDGEASGDYALTGGEKHLGIPARIRNDDRQVSNKKRGGRGVLRQTTDRRRMKTFLLVPLLCFLVSCGTSHTPPIVAAQTPRVISAAPQPEPVVMQQPEPAPQPAAIVPASDAPAVSHTKQAPTEYIGPRGGHYHYSASGKKVYDKK